MNPAKSVVSATGVLTPARLGVLLGTLAITVGAGATGMTVVGGFAGPLFGLTVGHDELLVADASVGVVPIRRGVPRTPIPLPGVTDVSVDPFGTGIWAVTGAIGGPGLGTENDTGQGLHIISRGTTRKVANLFEFETTFNPHQGPVPPAPVPDSNPYDVHALGPHAALVVDAGGNDLLRIDRWGNIKCWPCFRTRSSRRRTSRRSRVARTPPRRRWRRRLRFCGLPARNSRPARADEHRGRPPRLHLRR